MPFLKVKTRTNKRGKFASFVSKASLIFYDMIIFAAISSFIISLFHFGRNEFSKMFLYEGVINFVFIFASRFIFRIYRQIWKYSDEMSFIRMIEADACAFLVFYVFQRFVLSGICPLRELLCINTLVLLTGLSIRIIYRLAYKGCVYDTKIAKFYRVLLRIFAGSIFEIVKEDENYIKNVAIYGAGRLGESLAQELKSSASVPYNPVLFIDDDFVKIGREIRDIPIVGRGDNLAESLKKYEVQEVILAISGLSPEAKYDLFKEYEALGYPLKVYDHVNFDKKVSKDSLRDFSVEDVLFREQIDISDPNVISYYKGKTVLITGGGGSIGSELCRQIAKMSPSKIVILDIYENGAYDIQQELKFKYGADIDIRVEIISVCDKQSLDKVFAAYKPNIVLHAAAHKHVPLMEHNCCEAVENNVFGTLNVVETAEKYEVESFIMVSTDKAVNPTNVMGATKRMCEMIVLSHSSYGFKTKFSATRFGNVLGSAGSVVPLFKRQIAEGGPLTITDKRIIRYFMTIPEASQLVLTSGAIAKNGELFVLDMGKPVKILELAENMIRLSGLTPYTDIEIKETGLRPGEKLYEELLIKSDKLEKTENNLIFVERDDRLSEEALTEKLSALKVAVLSKDNKTVKRALKEVVPTFRSPDEINAGGVLTDRS